MINLWKSLFLFWLYTLKCGWLENSGNHTYLHLTCIGIGLWFVFLKWKPERDSVRRTHIWTWAEWCRPLRSSTNTLAPIFRMYRNQQSHCIFLFLRPRSKVTFVSQWVCLAPRSFSKISVSISKIISKGRQRNWYVDFLTRKSPCNKSHWKKVYFYTRWLSKNRF